MNWIRVDVALPTHRKTLELAKALGEKHALSYIVRLWCWARSSATNGRITGKNPTWAVEAAIGWEGKPGAFVEAAIAVGFLEAKGDVLLLHDWYEHNGKALRAAKQTAERVRRWRNRDKEKKTPKRKAGLAGRSQSGSNADPNAYAAPSATVTEPAANTVRTDVRDVRTDVRTTTTAGTPPPTPFALEVESSTASKPRKLSAAQKLREDLRSMRDSAFPGVVDDVEIKPAALTATFERLEKAATAKRATVAEAYSAYLKDDFARSRNPPCPLSLFVDGNKFRECLSVALRGRGAGPALTLVSGHKAGGYASQAEIEAQDFTVDRYDEPRPEGA